MVSHKYSLVKVVQMIKKVALIIFTRNVDLITLNAADFRNLKQMKYAKAKFIFSKDNYTVLYH